MSNPANGCTNTASVLQEVTPNIIMNLPPKTICEGDCVWSPVMNSALQGIIWR
ncbi:MAG: hypothetical protein IPH31_23330 [Lewinellaceae bacterium]|nr:hypothetical protein [Lewinellaceae bacterium]